MSANRRLADTVLLTAAAAVFVAAWLAEPNRPTLAVPGNGWWADYDQTHYIRSTLAFARGSLSPDAHWYLPLYALAAVPFLHLVPGDPFMPVNLACLLASAWISRALGQTIAPNRRWAGQLALALFVGTQLIPASIRTVWTTPWTSSLATPLMLGCTLCALRALAGRHLVRYGLLCGLTGALVGGCRPLDGALLLALVGTIVLAGTANTHRLRLAPCARWCVAICAGAVLGVAPSLLVYLAIWGPHMSPYLVSSAQIGFEPRLLALHWIEIMVSPRPALSDGMGIIGRLPFVATGLVGLVAAVVLRRRLVDLTVAVLVLSSMLLYLAYRDLHAPGIWAYHNVHYFKWSLGLLGLYTLAGLRLAWQRPRHIVWMAALGIGMVCWHASLVKLGGHGELLTRDRFAIDTPPMSTLDAIVIPGAGLPDRVYFGAHQLELGGTLVAPIADYKAFPVAGGMMLQPLRPWPGGRLDVTVASNITLNGDPIMARLRLAPGVPCWLRDWPQSCRGRSVLPAPRLQPGMPLLFSDVRGQEMALGGWCSPDVDGRWTCGTHSQLRFSVDPAARRETGALHIAVSASAIVPPGFAPVRVGVWTGDHQLAEWVWPDGATRTMHFDVPPALIGPDNTVSIDLQIEDPRRPSDGYSDSADVRELGIYARSIVWEARARPPM